MTVVNHSEKPRTIRFAPFEMDLIARQLKKNGRKVTLQPQPFNILEHLALQAKESVLREKLYSFLPTHNSYDSKHGLDSAIHKIRKALRDSKERPRFIETVRDRGYRFMKDVEFVPSVNHDSNQANSWPEDPFLTVVTQTRREFLVTDSPHELTLLFHRVACLLRQDRDHPKWSEGYSLLKSIQEARSRQNMLKHRIGFEAAGLVFRDRHALSTSDQEAESGYTLGCVPRGFWRPVILVVSHEIHQDENWISSARKATPIERAIYDQARKKTDT